MNTRLRPPVTVESVRTSAALRAFASMAQRVQGADPSFVPPLVDVRMRELRRAQRGPQRVELFLARRGVTPVGSIAVIDDPEHAAVHDEGVVFFGYFECARDPEAARALLEAAREQARSWDARTLRGPRNLTRTSETGVLVDGFETKPPMLAGHAPPWYAELLEGAGLRPHHDVLAWELPVVGPDGERAAPPRVVARHLERAGCIEGLSLRPASWLHLVRDLRLAHRVFVEAFRDVPDNTPMSLARWLRTGIVFLLLSSRHMLQIATVHGEAVGFALCFPDLNEAIGAMRGSLLPFGWLRFLRAVPRIRTASFKLLGVLPEHRFTGLQLLMAHQATSGSWAAGYRRVEASLVDARNRPMCRMLELCDARVYRRYRVYEVEV